MGINWTRAGSAIEAAPEAVAEVEPTEPAAVAVEAEPVSSEAVAAEAEPVPSEAVAVAAEPVAAPARTIAEADLVAALDGCGDAAPGELASCVIKELVSRGYQPEPTTSKATEPAAETEPVAVVA